MRRLYEILCQRNKTVTIQFTISQLIKPNILKNHLNRQNEQLFIWMRMKLESSFSCLLMEKGLANEKIATFFRTNLCETI